ncbi:potassium-transporting ATPase subunit KdpA, partial [Aeromicrobium sp.]
MSDTASGLLTIAALVGLLALVYVPFGDYMAKVYTTPKHSRVEKRAYRLIGVNPDSEQSPRAYTLSVLGFSFVSLLLLGAILLGQSLLPFDRGLPGMPKA